jgi:hypothetical protein
MKNRPVIDDDLAEEVVVFMKDNHMGNFKAAVNFLIKQGLLAEKLRKFKAEGVKNDR